MAVIYPGLVPSNVNKDAKYSVVTGDGGWEVRLTYRISSRERALLTTADHGPLVEMVNTVKEEINGQPGGAFYINEFKHVLVPAGDEYWLAGFYDPLLEFDFDGPTISPVAPDDLEPGDAWLGPHVGIPYTLMAGGNDIKCKVKTGRIEKEYRLSDYGKAAAAELARRLAQVKGSSGGRIYINECSEFFSPPPDGGVEHLYLGPLDEDIWFPPPDVPGQP
jgi:hypothetical protein